MTALFVFTDAPEIKTVSSCSSEGELVKCVCIVESKPPCMVYFVLSDRVLPVSKIEQHGSISIGTLRADFGSSEFVHCLVNNTVGNASHILSLPVNGKEVFRICRTHDMSNIPVSMNCRKREKWLHMASVWTGKMQNLYTAVTIGAGVVLVTFLIVVGFVKKW